MKTAIVALLVALGLSGTAMAGDLIGPVERVVDGDTIVVAGQSIRIWGVDAPERFTDEGKQATAFMNEILAGQSVYCRDTGTRSWNRIVAQCWVLGSDIARSLVDEGHAVDAPKYSGGYYAE